MAYYAGEPIAAGAPPKKDATSPTRSAIGSTRGSVEHGWRSAL